MALGLTRYVHDTSHKGFCAACGKSTKLPVHHGCGEMLRKAERKRRAPRKALSIDYFCERYGDR